MTEFGSMGKILILMGIVLVIIGGVVLLSDRIPWLGRLPGDISIHKRDFRLYFPITTSIIISIILSLILTLISRR